MYQYDGLNPVMLGGNFMLAGLGLDENYVRMSSGTATSLLADGLGSTAVLSNSSATTTATYAYSPYGDTAKTGSDSTPLDYTGRENDGATGLYYYRARYYSPQLGRFISEDPIGIGGGSNFYAYANGRPLDMIDPTGNLAFFWHFSITYDAARACGRGVLGSLGLAWQTMAVDFGTQGTTAADSNIHAMVGTTGGQGQTDRQSVADAWQAILDIESSAPLNVALHTAQDSATPDHYLHSWHGAHLDRATLLHLIHDTFPTDATVDMARSVTATIMDCACGH